MVDAQLIKLRDASGSFLFYCACMRLRLQWLMSFELRKIKCYPNRATLAGNIKNFWYSYLYPNDPYISVHGGIVCLVKASECLFSFVSTVGVLYRRVFLEERGNVGDGRHP